jgi:pyridoxine 5-phosphate synthase
MITLGVNIDHVATLRQARLGAEPDLLKAGRAVVQGGAHGITIHLREDRRHIQDGDVVNLNKKIRLPLNLEMSIANEIVRFALKVRPDKACLVPEKRQELTTEGGLAVHRQLKDISRVAHSLRKKSVEVSLFIDPIRKEIKASKEAGAQSIELHTGVYANAASATRRHRELARLKEAAQYAHSLGLRVNAGHGLNYHNVQPICRLPYLEELNIGHSIVARAVFVGLTQAVGEMAALMR